MFCTSVKRSLDKETNIVNNQIGNDQANNFCTPTTAAVVTVSAVECWLAEM
jgi:hypothetical protein